MSKKEFQKLSEQDIQQRLYGQYAESREKPKILQQDKKESKPQEPTQEKRSSGMKIVWGFVLGIAVILLMGGTIHLLGKTSRKVTKSSTAPKIATSTANRLYTIQVMVYEKREGAQKVVDDLKKRGFSAYIKENTTLSGKRQLRIYVGGFTTAEEAKSTLAMLKTNPQYQESFIRKK